MQTPETSLERRTLDVLLENLDGDTATLADLISSFLSDTARLFGELEQAAAQAQPSALNKTAHTLKSTSLAFGANAMAQACMELQRQAGAGSTTGAAAQIQFLKEEFTKVRTLLAQYLQSIGGAGGIGD